MKKKIKDLLMKVYRKKIYIILITLIFCVTGIAYNMTNIKCVATQKILVQNSIELVDTYKEIIKGSTVIEKVIKNLKADISVNELRDLIELSKIDNTNMIEIKVIGDSNELNKLYLSEITRVFFDTVNEIYKDSELYSLDITTSFYAKGGNVTIVAIQSAVIGFVSSIILFGIFAILDNKIKCCKDMENVTRLKSLISIPNIKSISKKKFNIKNIREYNNEVFKNLMTNIQFVNSNNLSSKSIIITSPRRYEGKTYVATNLAIEFAKAGKKVIIIDTDMRTGRMAKIFNLPNNFGFSNYLSNLDCNGNTVNEMITKFINDTEIKNLNVITSGSIPPNPTELLKTDKIKELIKDLKVFYDIIIFDTVCVLDSFDVQILSEMCDLILLLSSYKSTKIEDFTKSYEQIRDVYGSTIGIGLNKVPERRLKKKIAILKNTVKQNINSFINKTIKFIKKIINILKNFFKIFSLLLFLIIEIFSIIKKIYYKLRKIIMKLMNGAYIHTQNVKEYIKEYKSKKEKTKLIESGNMIFEDDIIEKNLDIEKGNNVKGNVRVSQQSEQDIKEEVNEVQMINKNIENEEIIKEVKEIEKIEEVSPIINIRKSSKNVKSKFDLMIEQQARQRSNIISNNEITVENEQMTIEDGMNEIQKISGVEEVSEFQKEFDNIPETTYYKEEPKYEEEYYDVPETINYEEMPEYENISDISKISEYQEEVKISNKENIELEEKIKKEQFIQNICSGNDNIDIDFKSNEILSEEMIRRQVELDEMIRLAEQEEYMEKQKIKQMKYEKRAQKIKAYREKTNKIKEESVQKLQDGITFFRNAKEKMDARRVEKNAYLKEERVRKEIEKRENRLKALKMRETKRAYKEIEKQKHRQELRIQEELQEDNLYPRPRL